MHSGELGLRYVRDDEWDGQLFAVARSGAFSGESSAWFDRLHLKETFVAALRTFPLSPTAPPMIEGGFWSKEKAPGVARSLEQCHLRLIVSPHDLRGTLLVRVELASETRKTADLDRQHMATVRFLTQYAAVALFADDLDRVLDGVKSEAVLQNQLS